MTEPPQPPPTTPESADPSMEEILASIRRILNDDDVPAETAEAANVATQEDDVLVLDDSMLVAAPHEPEAAPPQAALPPPEVELPPPPAVEVPVPVLAAPAADPWDQLMATPNLVAPETAAAAASSVDSLVRTLAADRATRVYGGGPTLEDMVRGELRPLLKDWLDTHLPPMVERLVRAEIERVVGREVP
jgi:cell pole-organizing protein PopZ